jgi:hypothetical protein
MLGVEDTATIHIREFRELITVQYLLQDSYEYLGVSRLWMHLNSTVACSEANTHRISGINISPEIARILIFAIDSKLKALHWYQPSLQNWCLQRRK